MVYEAEQESLGRRVALKILPFHALMDSRRLERFRREARAAGALQHANIVPVHGIGEEGGIHYYVMQFIPGQGLDRVFEEVRRLRGRDGPTDLGERPRSAASSLCCEDLERTESGSGGGPTIVPPKAPRREATDSFPLFDANQQYYRNVASLGAQVAEALAYAHGQGVLHRDIKPSNLLLEASGKVWITDFGLAKAEGSEDLTQSGEILGTLRYLPPERLKGWSDPRSDLYSLGLTLYELLTLKLVFEDEDRGRLVRRIEEEEPPRPRRIDRRIPRDLETIVEKAAAKEPSRRYQTAGEMAEDLRRFLRREPVAARSSGIWERGVKWARRKPAVAALIFVLAIGAATVLCGSLWYNARLSRESVQARANLSKAVEAVNRMLTWVGDQGLASVSQAQPVRRGLLEEAVQLLDGFLAENQGDPALRFEAARARARVAQVQQFAGDREQARASYEKSIAALERLRADFPGEESYRKELAAAVSAKSLFDEASLPVEGLPVSRFQIGKRGSGVLDAQAADLDGDGTMEIAAASRGASAVTVFRNRGGRAFAPTSHFPTGIQPYQLALLDLDGDRDTDAATIGKTGTISALRNKGDADFEDAITLPLNFEPWTMAGADLDGDGIPEVAAVGGLHYLRILRRGKDGEFLLDPVIETPGLPQAVAAGDFDGDGRADLAVGCRPGLLGSLAFFWNRGDGTLEPASALFLGAYPNMLEAADFDGDGDLDLAATDHLSGVVALVLNAGGRSFELGARFPFGPRALAIAARDLDGDGDADLVTSHEQEGIISLLLNDGNALFSHAAQFKCGGRPFRGSAADVDGDGRLDIVVANGIVDDVAVLFHARELAGKKSAELPCADPALVRIRVGGTASDVADAAAADFDGDRRTDLIAASRASSRVTILRNRGGRGFEPAGEFPAGEQPIQAAAADLDGDRDADVLTLDKAGTVSFLRNRGDGTLASPEKYDLGFVPSAMALADLDGDGRLEAAVAGGEEHLRVWRGAKDGTFSLSEAVPIPGHPAAVAAGDFDRDGRVDLAVAGAPLKEGVLGLLWNEGAGKLSEPRTAAWGIVANGLLAADFDGDGDLDLAAADNQNGQVAVAVNGGGQTFRVGTKLPSGPPALAVAAADLDEDGDVDLVASQESEGGISVLLNDGNGVFKQVVRFGTGGKPCRGAACDLDGDGRLDLAIANGIVNDVGVIFDVKEAMEGKVVSLPPAPEAQPGARK
ncbi:MAG: VCBS repeat-containing protein [Planctomycetes bacterium]|nr:VCBS repeat-containing protein [Planctomycetota bacterium]